jgi:GNAT superfamily N-acetyltransferase
MTRVQLERELAAGVTFRGYEDDTGALVGVMGIQPVDDVTLVRHAYVRPDRQGRGIGGALLSHLERLTTGPVLIGTWAAATWAIGFYQSQGYALVPEAETPALLRRYWDVSPRQVETSVVLRKAAPSHATTV